ncbi:MAG: copper amine oxidase N-terminal domain-containing protein [Oscillospiraceae bacterium]|jgi:hypothetical protein|nr:copper amine oxidase N-terminal domain-containing protein [Oscillospiraceae bacterium]
MKKLGNLKGFSLGIAVCLIFIVLISPAMAAAVTKTANLVYNNIKITLNGTALTPEDVNGNVVEPFIIDGSTYLPVRAIGNALGLGVDWDSANNTVLLTNGASAPSGTVLLEKNGIKITYLGIAPMKYGDGEEIKLYIENTSENKYYIWTKDESVNGIMFYPIFSSYVVPGKSAYDSLEFYRDQLEDIHVSSIQTVEFVFDIYCYDNGEGFESGIITISK